MAPSSLTCAFIIDGTYAKQDPEVRYNKARRLSVQLPASVDGETSAMAQSAPCSPGASHDAWGSEMDEASVERPEDICKLDDWDLEEAGWSADDAELTTPANFIQLAAVSEGKNVWNEAHGWSNQPWQPRGCNDCEDIAVSGELHSLLHDHARSSRDEDDSA